MSGSSYGRYPQEKKRSRYLFLLPLLPLAYLLGGVSFAVIRGNPAVPTPIVLAAATSSPTEENTPEASPSDSPTATPKPTERVGGASATPSILVSTSPNPSSVVIVSDVTFRITGSVQNLVPGVGQPVRLTLTNPNNVTIYVTSLTIGLPADSSPVGCKPVDNLSVTQSNASAANPIAVAAGSSVTLSAAPGAPQMTLLNLPSVNQDVCKGKSFSLTFGGRAHS